MNKSLWNLIISTLLKCLLLINKHLMHNELIEIINIKNKYDKIIFIENINLLIKMKELINKMLFQFGL